MEKESSSGNKYYAMLLNKAELEQLNSTDKGYKRIAISQMKEPDQYGNTHAVHGQIPGDKFSLVNLPIKEQDINKMDARQSKSGKEFIQLYVAPVNEERKQVKGLSADYVIYQVDGKGEEKASKFYGSGYNAEKDRHNQKQQQETKKPEQNQSKDL